MGMLTRAGAKRRQEESAADLAELCPEEDGVPTPLASGSRSPSQDALEPPQKRKRGGRLPMLTLQRQAGAHKLLRLSDSDVVVTEETLNLREGYCYFLTRLHRRCPKW